MKYGFRICNDIWISRFSRLDTNTSIGSDILCENFAQRLDGHNNHFFPQKHEDVPLRDKTSQLPCEIGESTITSNSLAMQTQ